MHIVEYIIKGFELKTKSNFKFIEKLSVKK